METTSRGVAILALEAMGLLGENCPLPDPEYDPLVVPDSGRSLAFSKMMEEQQILYQKIYGVRR
jgi:hypothetical protein